MLYMDYFPTFASVFPLFINYFFHYTENMHPVLFISLGPGEPELITVKGLKALQEADCIFCPETRIPAGDAGISISRAATILRQLDIREEKISRFALKMSKQRTEALAAYDATFAEVLKLHREGKKVCVTAEGDAGFYASIHYLYERLQKAGCPVEHIAGVPAFIAAGARAGIHIASGDETLTVVPGTATTDEITRLVAHKGAIVIMKLSKCQLAVREIFKLHPEYAYHYFENVGTPSEVYLNELTLIENRPFPYFSILIIRRQEED